MIMRLVSLPEFYFLGLGFLSLTILHKIASYFPSTLSSVSFIWFSHLHLVLQRMFN